MLGLRRRRRHRRGGEGRHEDLPAPPPKLYTVRLTADEIHALRLGLDAVDHGGHDNNPIIAADLKLRTVLDRISNDD